jgi:peroxiredoxin Q/BCP
MGVTTGKPAPAFALKSAEGKTIRLRDLLGKWVVLYFYPRDNTSGCTREACDFRDRHPDLAEASALVVGISPDSESSHARFAEKLGLPFLLLADPDKKVAKAYEVWKEKNMYGKKVWGIERSTFLIDPEGRVRRIWRKVKVAGHVDEVVRFLNDETGSGRK